MNPATNATRSELTRMGTILSASLLLLTACFGARPSPNVLLIVADDLREFSQSRHAVQTPHINELARRGRRFQRAYAQITKCSPSRASIMTGRRPERIGFYGNDEPVRETLAGAVPLQELFRSHGYLTARVGKIYHSRFEHEFRWDLAEDPGDRAADDLPWGPTENRDDEEPDGRTARRVAELLRQYRDRKFFIAAGLISTHAPLRAPRKYFELYPLESLPEVTESSATATALPRLAKGPAADLDVAPDERRAALQAYYACTSFVDAQLGIILDAMDELQLWPNTVVVFLSDHGFHLGDHGGMWRKTTLFEETTRVPLIIAGPGTASPGRATVQIVELIDVYPTLLDLAGLPAAGQVDGVSLVPWLRDPSRVVNDHALSVVQRPRGLGRTIRTERYRYTEWPDGSVELYDHSTEEGEKANLANSPAYSKTVRELQARLHGAP
jgi:uncharacterized sulfatase